MGSVMAYSGIVTKVRAMQAKLLKPEDFVKIANMQSVPEVIEFLKDQPAYGKWLDRMPAEQYHRGNVEKILKQSLFDDYGRLSRFAGAELSRYLKVYWKRYEIEVINYCFRIVFNNYDRPFDLAYKKEFFDKYSQISIDRLATSGNVRELVDNLRGTEYYEPLKKIQDVEGAKLYDYDLALTLYFFTDLWKKNKKILKKEEVEIVSRDYGMQMDLLNLQWIYRAKKYYHMLPPDIYQITLPVHYHLSIGEFKALVEAPTVEQFTQEVEKTYYKRKFGRRRARTLEQIYKDCLRTIYLSDRRKNPYSIATLNTYLFLKEEEIEKLTTAMECIRYGLTPHETLGYVGGVIG